MILSNKKINIIFIAISVLISLISIIAPEEIIKVKIKTGLSAKQELTSYYYNVLNHHRRIDSHAPHNSIVFFGDSHIQGLLTSAVINNSLNYGIGADTSYGLLQRIPYYRNSIQNAKAIILAIGANDYKWRTPQEYITYLQQILAALRLQTNVTIYLHALFPTHIKTNERRPYASVKSINKLVSELESTDNRILYINVNEQLTNEAGDIKNKYYQQDGVHLNGKGYQLWIEFLRDILNEH